MSKKKTIYVQGGAKKGGYEYTVLSTPNEENYHFLYLKQYNIKKDTYWHGYIFGKELKQKCLPIDANPRKPGPTKIVRLMQSTIQKTPESFHHLNNGITVICEEVKYDEKTCRATIRFGRSNDFNGDGICNGGHTYYAINQYAGNISDDMLARIEFVVLDPCLNKIDRIRKIKEIAEARNSHNELESITSAHYSGYYDKFIEYLGTTSKYFEWYEGDPNTVKGAEKADTLIAKLTSLSPHWFSHYMVPNSNNLNHMSAARNQGTLHKRWLKEAANEYSEKSIYYMVPLLNDILLLKDEISMSLLRDDFQDIAKVWRRTRIWSYLNERGEVLLRFKKGKADLKGYNMSHTFSTLLLGAFRENVWFSIGDNGIDYVGWIADPVKLWKDHKIDLLKALHQIASSISAPSFGNAFLQNAAAYSYQITTWKYGVSIREKFEQPEVIYNTQTYQKYVKEKSPELTTHHLYCKYNPDIPPFVEMREGLPPKGDKSTLYKKAE